MNRTEFFGLLDGMSAGELIDIQNAYWLAKKAHVKQTHSGVRYFEHPRHATVTLVKRGYKRVSVIIAALLHDVVEDTDAPPYMLVKLFGHETWRYIALLSKSASVFDPVTGHVIGKYQKPTEQYYEEIAKAPAEVRLIKLADRHHNISSMEGWTAERKKRYVEETRQYLIPIARNTDPWFENELTSLADKACASIELLP